MLPTLYVFRVAIMERTDVEEWGNVEVHVFPAVSDNCKLHEALKHKSCM